jgi:hypothetical protein
MESCEQDVSPRTSREISCREELNTPPSQPERGREVETAAKVEGERQPTDAAVR